MLYLELRLEALSATVGCAVKTLQEFRREYPGAPDPPLLQPQDVVDIATGIKSAEEFIAKVTNHLESLSVCKDQTEAKSLTEPKLLKEPTQLSEARTPSQAEFTTEARKLLKSFFASKDGMEAKVSFEVLHFELCSPESDSKRNTGWKISGGSWQGTIVSENPTETAAPNEDEETETKSLTEAKDLIEPKDPPEAKPLTKTKDTPEAKSLSEAKDPPEAKSRSKTEDPLEAKYPTKNKDPPEAKSLSEAKVSPEAKSPSEAKDPPENKSLTETKDPPEAKPKFKTEDPPEAKSLSEAKDPHEDKSLTKTKDPPEAKTKSKTKDPPEAKSPSETKDPPEAKSPSETKDPPEAKSLTKKEDPPEDKSPSETEDPPKAKSPESHSVKGDPTGTEASHKEVLNEVVGPQEDSNSREKIRRNIFMKKALSKWFQGSATGSDVTTETKDEVSEVKVPSEAKPLAEADVQTEAEALCGELFVDEEDFFDIRYDYDFTRVKDRLSQFKRGGETYSRPCGWLRFGLKVLGKYKDGDGWLGEGDNAWPVSYHGTTVEGAKGIIKTHYKAGPCQQYGRGIYSTPNVTIAFGYSKTFTSQTTKKTYKVILQNRINPKPRTKCKRKDYWLVPVPEGRSTTAEEWTSENSIRPYGLLMREVKDKAKNTKQ